MGFLTNLIQKRNSLERPSTSLRDPAGWDELFGSSETSSGVRVTHKSSIGHPPLWRGLNLICSSVAKLPLDVYRRTPDSGRERDSQHPARRLLRRKANAALRSGILLKTLTYHAVLFGNGYAFINRDAMGRPVSLLPLSPFETFPFNHSGQLWYRTKIGNDQIRLPAADVLHIRGLGFDGLTGHSVIEILASAIGGDIAPAEFAARFFGEGANASGILMIPGHLKGDAIRQTIRDFERIAVGAKNSHKVGLLQDGVKWQPFSVDGEKAQLLDTREFGLLTISNVLSLPPHKLGHPARTSYNSLEMENQSFLDDSLDPWLCEWESECDDKLLSEEEHESDSHFIEFNRSALLRADQETRYTAYATGRQGGWLSVNDIRRRENMPSIGPEGDVYLSPLNMTPADQLDADPEPQNEPDEPTQDDSQNDGQDDIRSATRDAIRERLDRLLGVASGQITKAAGRDGNFVEKIDSLLQQHQERTREALTPLLRVWLSVTGIEVDAADAAQRCSGQMKSSLLDAAGRSTPANLSSNVEQVISGWTGGLDSLVDSILGSET